MYRYTADTALDAEHCDARATRVEHALAGWLPHRPRDAHQPAGWNSDHEAIDLAIGMDEKVFWSRLLKVGGPHVQRDFSRIVGGKCVMHPSAGSRVGERRDTELLDFAIACFRDVEASHGFFLTTGQDLGTA